MYTLNIPLNTTTWCTYLSILLLQIVDNCTECGSALRSTRVTQDRGRWIRPTSQHGRPLLLNALHFHQQYPHLDLDPKGVPKNFQIEIKMSSRSLLNYFKSEQDQRALSKPRMQFDFSSKHGAPRYQWLSQLNLLQSKFELSTHAKLMIQHLFVDIWSEREKLSRKDPKLRILRTLVNLLDHNTNNFCRESSSFAIECH